MARPTTDESRPPLLPQYEAKYHVDDGEDANSDTTRISAISSSETMRLLEQHSTYDSPRWKLLSLESWWMWIRWGIIIVLQAVIIVLLSWPHTVGQREKDVVLKGKFIETGSDINGLYKTTSHNYLFLNPEEEKYVPNMTSDVNRDEVRRNWDLLMPRGSGSVAITDYKDYPFLGDPITDDPLRPGPIFEASWTHALHCLYYTVDSYHQLIVNGRSENDNPHHAAHCFEYLRNSILCNLDMTLEGSMSTSSDKTRGQPHVCRNRQEAIDWIEARRVDDLQDIVGPTAVVTTKKK